MSTDDEQASMMDAQSPTDVLKAFEELLSEEAGKDTLSLLYASLGPEFQFFV
jgi:hypothetical protein